MIDDAIIVLENIFRHTEEERRPPFEAAITGTREISLAVTATTISLVVIFLPVAFMGGLVGKFWNSFGLTATFAILTSLVVAFTRPCRRLCPEVGESHSVTAVARGV